MNKSAPNIPLVSVWMITYNHEQYIKQAIESILMQKTTFTIELVIGEDCSTDNTASIIREYENKHPEIIKVRYNIQNLGIIPNMIKTLEECNGKYIAMCEGDDFWNESEKLQKQIDFLESNENFSASAHRCYYQDEIHNSISYFGLGEEKILILKDLLEFRPFHTASLVFKKEVVVEYMQNLKLGMISGDKMTNLLCGIYGPIMYFKEPMATYRKNEGGISNNHIKDLDRFVKNNIVAFNSIKRKIPLRDFTQLIYYEYCKILTNNNYPKFGKQIRYYFKSILYSLPNFIKNRGQNINNTIAIIKSLKSKIH